MNPSTVVAALELLACEQPLRFFGKLSVVTPKVLLILPSLSPDEVFRLTTSLVKLGIDEGTLLKLCVAKVAEGTVAAGVVSTHQERFLESHCGVLSVEMCCELHKSFPSHSLSSAVGKRINSLLPELSLNELLSVEEVCRDSGNVTLRRAVVTRIHGILPALDIADLLRVLTAVNDHFELSLISKDALQRCEDKIQQSKEVETTHLLCLLRVPHRLHTKILVFRTLTPTQISDLDRAQMLELFNHFVDAALADVTSVPTRVFELVCANMYLTVPSLTSSECCDILESSAILKSYNLAPPEVLEGRLRRHFFAAFREEFCSPHRQYSNESPLEVLIRFLVFRKSCAPLVAHDSSELIQLQCDCVSCEWRVGPLLVVVRELLCTPQAVHPPFFT